MREGKIVIEILRDFYYIKKRNVLRINREKEICKKTKELQGKRIK